MKKTAYFLLSTLILFTACKKSSYTDADKLVQFHQLYVQQPEKKITAVDSLEIYIDYSSGMYEAMYSSLQTAMNDIFVAAQSPKTNYYRAGATMPYRIDIEAKENIPSVTTNYTEKKSILDKPIEMIVQRNRQAVFITDFEFVPTGQKIFEGATPTGRIKTWINPDAWAVELFEKWLSKGNRLDIYAAKFMRNGTQPQFVYALVFTPLAMLNQEDMFLTRIANLDNKLSSNLYHFTFQTATQLIETEQKDYDAMNGGLHSSLAPLEFIKKPEMGLEYYQLGFKDIDKYILGDETEKDKRILRKLFWKGDVTTYKDLAWGLQVYDMTETFAAYQQVQEQAPAQYEIDPETGDSTLMAGQTMAFKYVEGKKRTDIFDLVVNKETQEFGLKLKPDFIKLDKESELYRVELQLQGATFNENADLAKVLQWQDKEGFAVRSLYESIVEAMKRVEKNNTKKLHSYYVEFQK
jgi:hypothetical protein